MVKELVYKIRIYGIVKTIYYVLLECQYWLNKLLFKSFSQCGEDLIVDRYFKHKLKGFYVDIGANDPEKFNNTKKFYDMGWHGILIEPNIHKFDKLKKFRANDTVENCGISCEEGKITFYEIFPDTLSTFSKTTQLEYVAQGFKLVSTLAVNVFPLPVILSKHHVEKIDFLSLDTEGYDLNVLASNDWSKYRPKLICIETEVVENTGDPHESFAAKNAYMLNLGYELLYHGKINSIYKDTHNEGL